MFLEFWGTFSVASGHSQERLVRSWVSFQGRCVCFIVLFPHAHGHRTNGGLFYIYLRSFLAPGLLIFNPRLANRVVSVARMLQNRPFFTSPCASVCMLPVGSGNLSHNQHVLVQLTTPGSICISMSKIIQGRPLPTTFSKCVVLFRHWWTQLEPARSAPLALKEWNW